MAERYGFLQVVDFFGKLEAEHGDSPNEIVFYDSQCGLPLYVAPRGRTYEAWKKESISHGWPSFREEEAVHDNVHVEAGYNGELVSKCNTHLGHNLPDAKGRRDCVNLMCMSGVMASSNTSSLSPLGSGDTKASSGTSPSNDNSNSKQAAQGGSGDYHGGSSDHGGSADHGGSGDHGASAAGSQPGSQPSDAAGSSQSKQESESNAVASGSTSSTIAASAAGLWLVLLVNGESS